MRNGFALAMERGGVEARIKYSRSIDIRHKIGQSWMILQSLVENYCFLYLAAHDYSMIYRWFGPELFKFYFKKFFFSSFQLELETRREKYFFYIFDRDEE